MNNAIYLSNKAGEFDASFDLGYETSMNINEYTFKNFGFMLFNLIFTALIGFGGLSTIPFCFKMIKQRKTKTKIFYILTLIQILLQTIFPFMRAVIVIVQVSYLANPAMQSMKEPINDCILVGFQVNLGSFQVSLGFRFIPKM